MPLRPQILLDGERLVQALRLKHDSDLPAHRSRIAFYVAARDHCVAVRRDHHGRENPEQRGFAPAVRSEQTEDLARAHVETDVRQRGAVSVSMG